MRKLLPGRRVLIAAGLCGVCSLSVPAFAADLGIGAPSYKAPAPIVHTYDWTGFYVGGNVGGHWGSDKLTTSTDVNFDDAGTGAGAAIDAASPVTLHPRGFIGGAQIGYNLEGSGGVFGIEADANWLGGTASRTLTNIAGINAADQMTNSVQGSFLSTLRMRWGTTVISDRSLLFITAGFAFETLQTTDSMAHHTPSTVTSISTTTTEPGLTAGGGFECAITDNLSAKAEYLFVAIKDVNTTIPATGSLLDSIGVTHSYTEQVARFGLNLKFSNWTW